MIPQPGERVAGRYLLEERVASGGMGEVWRARDETLGRPVAVKLLRPDTTEASGFVERFRAEARHSASLSHPNIATVYDFGEDEHTAYLVMEFLDGRPLSQVIAERAPLDPAEVSGLLAQAALALQAAHDAGVVHRDVKPANIVVGSSGVAKLTDFGIARALHGSTMTQTGEVLGTPHYLAPEQARGEPAGPHSDVYALAVVGYEMLTGNRPFTGDSMITAALAHVSQPVPQLPPDVPEPLRTTLTASLAKDPAQRPESAVAFARALGMPQGQAPGALAAAAAATLPPAASPVGRGPAGPPTVAFSSRRTVRGAGDTPAGARRALSGPGRRPSVVALAATAVAVLLAIAASLWLSGPDDPMLPAQTPTSATPATSAALTSTTSPPVTTPTTAPAPPTSAPRVTAPVATDPATKGKDAAPGKDGAPGKGDGKGKGKK